MLRILHHTLEIALIHVSRAEERCVSRVVLDLGNELLPLLTVMKHWHTVYCGFQPDGGWLAA